MSTAAMRLFVPAASVVQSGSTLGWLAADNNPHTATDLATGCFHTGFGTIVRGTVLFFIDAGTLFASSDGDAPEACAAAPLPDGSFLLEYTCLLHPEMDGNIVVIQ